MTIRTIVALAVGILLPCASLATGPPPKPLSDYVRTKWTSNDGLPENGVRALLQTRDGYLWVGTEEGLARFDGQAFTVFNRSNTKGLVSNVIVTLFQDSAGVLWIGTNRGLLFYRDGEFTSVPSEDGFGAGIRALCEDEEGVLWIGTTQGLKRLQSGRVESVYTPSIPPGQVITALSVRGKQLAVGSQQGLRLFTLFNHGLSPVTGSLGLDKVLVGGLLYDNDGTLWVSSDQGLFQIREGKARKYKVSKEPVTWRGWEVSPLGPNSAGLWVGVGRDLCRKTGERFKCYHPPDANPGDSVLSLIVDREGSLWVGHAGTGLERYKYTILTTYAKSENLAGLVTTIQEGPAGNLVITSGFSTVYVLGEHASQPLLKKQFSSPIILSMQDHKGNIWASGTKALWEIKTNGQTKAYTTSDGLPSNAINGVYEDRAGAIWATSSHGLARLFNEQITAYTAGDGLVKENNIPEARPWVMFEDHTGTLWFGSRYGLSRWSNGHFQTAEAFPAAVAGGAPLVSSYVDHDNVFWFGTKGDGLFRVAGGNITSFTQRDGLSDDSIWSILEDDGGNFWMSSNRGIFRVKKADLDSFAQGTLSRIDSISYGASDGMKIPECNGGAQGAGIKTSRGQLLFACIDGVVAVTPRLNALTPPVMIEEVSINGNTKVRPGVRLPVGKGDLEFKFAALSLVAAEKNQYRYKLEGYDADWIASGNRRVAYYTNLPPGQYRFQVIAANNDGVWNKEGASFSFHLQPHYYQTVWFLMLSVACGAGVLWALYRRRLHLATKVIYERYQVRLAERTRIARELHDTLLQSLAGASLQLNAISKTMAAAPQVRDKVDSIRQQMDAAFLDARQRIWDLRSPVLEGRDFPAVLLESLEKLTGARGGYSLTITGQPRAVTPNVEEQLLRIGCECVANALRHAQAREITVELRYETEQLVLSVSDDGRGFDTLAIAPGNGHWGLRNMQERARDIGAFWTLRSEPGQGTKVETFVSLIADQKNHT